ncbi:unnamed protein product [Prorocentrum cordatum]|uniref:histidine kinase n=1 Tax=Prorocentrum cordatum TaxID=2364126 RepID=A0ABN9VDE5_9DINO|nr:unnamed protein product [Polarella glacialis]
MGQKLVKQFIHPVHRRSVRSVLGQALASHEVANFELTLFTKEGEQRDILLSATPRWGQNGEINGVVCVGQDVTEMKKHRERAERMANDYARLINTANAPILGTDKNACVNEWNGWVAQKSGYSKMEVRGKILTNYIADTSKATVLDVLAAASKGNPTETFEVELAPKKDEKPVSLLLNATPRVSPQGDIIGVICVGQDITHIREIEHKKSSFMAIVSHELKSPLNGIIGLSSGLVEAAQVDTLAHKQLKLIHNCASRLLDMVNNIMDASDLVQDKRMKFSRDQVRMGDVIEEVVVLCRNSQDRHGKKLMKDGVQLIYADVDLPNIEADPYRCTQLIYNLVTNALKFTHQGFVEITASADYDKEEICVVIRDTGIGIAPERTWTVSFSRSTRRTSPPRAGTKGSAWAWPSAGRSRLSTGALCP